MSDYQNYDKKKVAEELAGIINADKDMFTLPIFDNKGYYTGKTYDPRISPNAGTEFEQPNPQRLQLHLQYMEEKYNGTRVKPGQKLPDFQFKDPYKSKSLGDAAINIGKRSLNDGLVGLGWQVIKTIFGSENAAFAFFDDRGWRPNEAESMSAGVGSLIADAPIFGLFGKLATSARIASLAKAKNVVRILRREKFLRSAGMPEAAIKDAIKSEMGKIAAESFQIAGKAFAKSPLDVGITSSAGAFGGHSFVGTSFRAITDPQVGLEDVIKETAISTVLGGIMGVTGHAAAEVFKNAGKITKYVGEGTSEIAALTASSRLLHGPQKDPKTGKDTTIWHDLAHTTAMIVGLRLGLKGFSKVDLRNTTLDKYLGEKFTKLSNLVKRKKIEEPGISTVEGVERIMSEYTKAVLDEANEKGFDLKELNEAQKLNEENARNIEKATPDKKKVVERAAKTKTENKRKKKAYTAKETAKKHLESVIREDEKGKSPFTEKAPKVEYVDKITSKGKEHLDIGMQRDKKTGVILIDKKAMSRKFKEKAWTKPHTQTDGSKAKPLPKNTFKSVRELTQFGIAHERFHGQIKRGKSESIGDYETRINDAALKFFKGNQRTSSGEGAQGFSKAKDPKNILQESRAEYRMLLKNVDKLSSEQVQRINDAFKEGTVVHKAVAIANVFKEFIRGEKKPFVHPEGFLEKVGEVEYKGEKAQAYYDNNTQTIKFITADGTVQESITRRDFSHIKRRKKIIDNSAITTKDFSTIVEDFFKAGFKQARAKYIRFKHKYSPADFNRYKRQFSWTFATPVIDPLSPNFKEMKPAEERAARMMEALFPLIDEFIMKEFSKNKDATDWDAARLFSNQVLDAKLNIKNGKELTKHIPELSGAMDADRVAKVKAGATQIKTTAENLGGTMWRIGTRTFDLQARPVKTKDGETIYDVKEIFLQEEAQGIVSDAMAEIEVEYQKQIAEEGKYHYDEATQSYYIVGEFGDGARIPVSARDLGPNSISANLKGTNLVMNDEMTHLEKMNPEDGVHVPEDAQVVYTLKFNPPPKEGFWQYAHKTLKERLEPITGKTLSILRSDRVVDKNPFLFKNTLSDYGFTDKQKEPIYALEQRLSNHLNAEIKRLKLSKEAAGDLNQSFHRVIKALRTTLVVPEVESYQLPSPAQAKKGTKSKSGKTTNYISNRGTTLLIARDRTMKINYKELFDRDGNLKNFSGLKAANLQYRIMKTIQALEKSSNKFSLNKVINDILETDHRTYETTIMQEVNLGDGVLYQIGRGSDVDGKKGPRQYYYAQKGRFKKDTDTSVVSEHIDSLGGATSGNVKNYETKSLLHEAQNEMKKNPSKYKDLEEAYNDLYDKGVHKQAKKFTELKTRKDKKTGKLIQYEAEIYPNVSVPKISNFQYTSVDVNGKKTVRTKSNLETYEQLLEDFIKSVISRKAEQTVAINLQSERVPIKARGEVEFNYHGNSPTEKILRVLIDKATPEGDPKPSKVFIYSEPFELGRNVKYSTSPSEMFYGKNRMGYVVGEFNIKGKKQRMLYDFYTPRELATEMDALSDPTHSFPEFAMGMYVELVNSFDGNMYAPESFKLNPHFSSFSKYMGKLSKGRYRLKQPDPSMTTPGMTFSKAKELNIVAKEERMKQVVGEDIMLSWMNEFIQKHVPKDDVNERARLNAVLSRIANKRSGTVNFADVISLGRLHAWDSFINLKTLREFPDALAEMVSKFGDSVGRLEDINTYTSSGLDAITSDLSSNVEGGDKGGARNRAHEKFNIKDTSKKEFETNETTEREFKDMLDNGENIDRSNLTPFEEKELDRAEGAKHLEDVDSYTDDDTHGFSKSKELRDTNGALFSDMVSLKASAPVRKAYDILDKLQTWYDKKQGREVTLSPGLMTAKLFRALKITQSSYFRQRQNELAGGEAVTLNSRGGRANSIALTARSFGHFESVAHEVFHQVSSYMFNNKVIPEKLSNELQRLFFELTPADYGFGKGGYLDRVLKDTLDIKKPFLDKLSPEQRAEEIKGIKEQVLRQEYDMQEAFAIYGHYWTNHPELAKELSPLLFEKIGEFLKNIDNGDGLTAYESLKEYQSNIAHWLARENDGSVLKLSDALFRETGPRPYMLSDYFREGGKLFYRKFVDRLEPMRKIWETLANINVDNPEFAKEANQINFYKLSRALQQAETAQVESMFAGTPYLIRRDLTKIYMDGKNGRDEVISYRRIVDIANKRGNGEEIINMLGKYNIAKTTLVWARAARKAAKEGKGNQARFTGMEPTTARKLILEVESHKDFDLVKEAGGHFRKLMSLMVDQIEMAGFLTKDEAERYRKFNPWYMALNREQVQRLQDKWSDNSTKKTGLAMLKSAVSSRNEVHGQLANPFLSTFERMHSVLRASNKHLILSKFVESMKYWTPGFTKEHGSSEHLEELKGDALKHELEVSMPFDAFKKAADNAGIQVDDMMDFYKNSDLQIMAWAYAEEVNPIKDKFVVPIKDSTGKLTWYKLRGDLYDAMIRHQAPHMAHWMTRMASAPVKVIRHMAVVWNPSFWLRNIPRDMITAKIQTRNNITFSDMLTSYKDAFTYIYGKADPDWKPIVREFFDSAVVKSNLQAFSDIGITKKDIDRYTMIKERNRIIKYANKLRVAAEKISTISEVGPRLAEFSKAREADKDMVDSIIDARDVSIDFLRAGSTSQFLNMLIPFFNPAVQGLDRIITQMYREGVKGGHYGPISKAASMLITPTVGLWLINHNQDWYKDLSEEDKVKWWHFQIPGTDDIVRIPKPFDWGMIFGALPEVILNKTLGAEDQDFSLKRGVAGSLSRLMPLELSVSGAIGQVAIARPFLEFTTNHDFYFDSDIVDFFTAQKPSELQFYKNTPNVYRAIGQLGLGPITSPLKVKKFMSTISAGVSDDVAYLIDKAFINQFVDAPSDKKKIFTKTERNSTTIPFVPFLRGERTIEQVNRTKKVKLKKAKAKLKAKLDYGLITREEYNQEIKLLSLRFKTR